jgi:hypothetical protein
MTGEGAIGDLLHGNLAGAAGNGALLNLMGGTAIAGGAYKLGKGALGVGKRMFGGAAAGEEAEGAIGGLADTGAMVGGWRQPERRSGS